MDDTDKILSEFADDQAPQENRPDFQMMAETVLESIFRPVVIPTFGSVYSGRIHF